MDIILYFIQLIQQLYQQNIWLIKSICKYIPLDYIVGLPCPMCGMTRTFLAVLSGDFAGAFYVDFQCCLQYLNGLV